MVVDYLVFIITNYSLHISIFNIIGDELLLNFRAKFQRQFVMPWQPFHTSQCQDGDEVLKCRE